jgi:hypothetical protein
MLITVFLIISVRGVTLARWQDRKVWIFFSPWRLGFNNRQTKFSHEKSKSQLKVFCALASMKATTLKPVENLWCSLSAHITYHVIGRKSSTPIFSLSRERSRTDVRLPVFQWCCSRDCFLSCLTGLHLHQQLTRISENRWPTIH